jgi:hypothetical protein
MMVCTDTLCFPGSHDENLIQPRASRRARRASVVNVTPVLGIVKVEEGAMEEEGGSEIELFDYFVPRDAGAVPNWALHTARN